MSESSYEGIKYMVRSLKLTYWLCLGLVALAACSGPKEKGSSEEFPPSGTYESATPWPSGYIYYRMELRQDNAHYTGSLIAGNYLAVAESGGYINPDILIDCSAEGAMENENLILNLTVKKVDRISNDAPDLLALMNFPMLDADTTATAWTFHYADGLLTSESGSQNEEGADVLNWIKIK